MPTVMSSTKHEVKNHNIYAEDLYKYKETGMGTGRLDPGEGMAGESMEQDSWNWRAFG